MIQKKKYPQQSPMENAREPTHYSENHPFILPFLCIRSQRNQTVGRGSFLYWNVQGVGQKRTKITTLELMKKWKKDRMNEEKILEITAFELMRWNEAMITNDC